MTGFAAEGGAISARLLHTLLELPFVRISMATAAGKFVPVIDNSGLGLESVALFVAIAARDGHVTTG